MVSSAKTAATRIDGTMQQVHYPLISRMLTAELRMSEEAILHSNPTAGMRGNPTTH